MVLASFCQVNAKGPADGNNRLYFIENSGQVVDQFAHSRNDIQFVLRGKGVNLFVGNGQLHYQFSHVSNNSVLPDDNNKYEKIERPAGSTGKELGYDKLPGKEFTSYRLDVELAGANQDATVIKEQMLPYYENYYLPGCPAGGATAHTFEKITYKNIYPSIDWVIYIKDNKLEHEFVIGKGGDAANIKLKYSGQDKMKINQDGSFTVSTPMGSVTEHAPFSYNSTGVIFSSYNLDKSVLGYTVNGKGSMVIDPGILWATYYGPDSLATDFYACVSDHAGSIYAGGLTWGGTSIATSGSYQSVYGGGCDAFLVKFDTSGNRIWSTYYGGTGGDWGIGVSCDKDGNVYMAGVTQGSLTGIATAGCQQPVYGGGLEDGFLVKFTANGIRKWGTYLGGTGAEIPGAVVCDTIGHVYVGGFTTGSTTNISTPGSFLPATGGGYEDYLVQYDTAGVRQWGTYYGGSGAEYGGSVCSDGVNVFMTGYTSSTTGMTTLGCYQPVYGGSNDVFVAKFDNTGLRNWGTYYGGAASETAGGITCDYGGNILILGATNSDAGIASPGCFQAVRGGGTDAFLLQLEPELGGRLWCTYYGGPGAENIDMSRITADDSGNVYIIGSTTSLTGIATIVGWQTGYGGGANDGFFAKFTGSGNEKWSTYYGGVGDEMAKGLTFDAHCVYMCGKTTSNNNIATAGAFLPTIPDPAASTYYYGFLARVGVIDTPDITLYTGTEPAAMNFAVFPNPNNGSFVLAGTVHGVQGNLQITVTDAAGRVVMTDHAAIIGSVINKSISFEPEMSAGVYFLNLKCDGVGKTLKLVKE